MIVKNYDQSVKINHNPNCPQIPDHPYRILKIGGSGLGKTMVLLNETSKIRHSKNLFVSQRSIQIKVSIAYQRKRKSRD